MSFKIYGQDELMASLNYQVLMYEQGRDSIPKKVAEAGVKRARDAYNVGRPDGNRRPVVFMKKVGYGSYEVTAMGVDLAYMEYGTGIVGKNTPHPEVSKGVATGKYNGERYTYDRNNHGDRGWKYPISDSEGTTYRWSKGMVGKRGMYYASLKMREVLSQYTLELARKKKGK